MNIQKALSFDDVLLVPSYSDIESRKPSELGGEIDISTQMGPYKLNIPLVSSPMDTVTGSTMARRMAELGGLGIIHRFMSLNNQLAEFQLAAFDTTNNKVFGIPKYNIGVAIGVNDTIERAEILHDYGARIFCVDVAHGHSKLAGRAIKQLREFKDTYIIAGNIATYEGAQYLFDCGAQAVRIGIGGGSACTTRMRTGCGVPTFAAIQDCSRSEAFKIADGGIRSGNDVAKALAVGADTCMLGGLLSGTDETPGEILEERATNVLLGGMIASPPGPIIRRYKKFRGMATLEAERDFKGEVSDWKAAEGVSIEAPYKGPVENVIKELLAGLRSSMSYLGARTIRKFKHRAKFIEITNNGYIEGTPHGQKTN